MNRKNAELPKRKDYNELLQNVAKYNKNHKLFLEKSTNVGCYYCRNIYPATEIEEYCDKGQTAICAYCEIDSVLPDAAIPITRDLLKEMHDYWFESEAVTFRLDKGEIIDIIDKCGKYDAVEFEKYRKEELERLKIRQNEVNEKKLRKCEKKT